MAKIWRDLEDQPTGSIPQVVGGCAETIAAYRFFDVTTYPSIEG
jgi:hypothetical protein